MDPELKNAGMLLEKCILEVRFEESLYFGDNSAMTSIYRKIKKNFPKFSRADDGGYSYSNQADLKKSLNIGSMRIAVEQVESESTISFKTLASGIVEDVSPFLEVQEYTRVGFRVIYGINTDSFKDAAGLILDKITQVNSDIFNDFDKNGKLKLSYSYSKNSVGYNVNIRPSSEMSFEGDIENGITKYQVKNQLMIDVDSYVDTAIPPSSLNAVFRTLRENNIGLSQKIKSFFFGG